MSTEIDWSKAPEGATRYHPETSKIIEHWLKMVGDEEWIWTSAGKRWMPHIDPVEGGEYYERPAPTWSGEGLPPVGTVCEVNYRESWKVCEIIAHFKQRAGMVAAFTVERSDGGKSLDSFVEGNFRPLRTPEQIAAEERLDRVHAIEGIMLRGQERAMTITQIAAAIDDAGYRKVTA